MATGHSSRWADDDQETAETAAQRKRVKEEKKKLKEEKLQKTELAQTQQPRSENSASKVNGDIERPPKRQRLDDQSDNNSESARRQTSRILEFPTTRFEPCGDVDNYELLNNIEEGSYGFVSRARHKATGQIVAVKRLKMEYTNDGFPVTGLREIQTLMASRHANVVTLREVVMGESLKDIYLVMDFLEHDLKTVLDEHMSEPFLPSETKTLMRQLVSGAHYLHTHWILHRDLKTSNLLLSNRGELKIADFGMARYTGSPPPQNLTQLVVTLWYRAPELLLGTQTYNSSIDIWSIGCIFAELLTRKPIFQGRNEVDQLSKIFALLGTPTSSSWPEFRALPNAKALFSLLSSTRSSSEYSGLNSSKFPYLTSAGLNLLSSLLSQNPSHRPSADEILKHSYFAEDPRPKPKEMFPTFPSKGGQEKRRRKETPPAPKGERGKEAPKLREEDFQSYKGLFARGEDEGGEGDEQTRGPGFALRLG